MISFFLGGQWAELLKGVYIFQPVAFYVAFSRIFSFFETILIFSFFLKLF